MNDIYIYIYIYIYILHELYTYRTFFYQILKSIEKRNILRRIITYKKRESGYRIFVSLMYIYVYNFYIHRKYIIFFQHTAIIKFSYARITYETTHSQILSYIIRWL